MSLENTSGRNVLANYGTRVTDTVFGGEVAGEDGQTRVVEYTFDAVDLPVALNTTDLAQKLPAGALITGATFDIITPLVSTSTTSDLDIGIADDDGGATITDADGLFTAAELTQTVILVDGGRTVAAAGALLNTTIAEAAQVTITPTVDDFLTGRAKLTVTYQQSTEAQGS
jgi:hypothetical protein